MASAWWMFGRNPSSSSKPSATEFLQLSKTNIDEIVSLLSIQPHREPLNAYQCQSMSLKFVKIFKNIESLANASRALVYPNVALTTTAFENFFRVSQRAREIVEDCCSLDWCLASTFQIHNEEAFKDILLDTSLCYNAIIDLATDINKDHVSIEDLRSTPTFDPPTSIEVLQDQLAFITRYTIFLNDSNVSSSFIRKHLAKYLLRRLNCNPSKSNMNSEDFDVCNLNLWQDGKSPDDEWGKQLEFLGVGASGGVCKTTWLDVLCAQKVIEDCTPDDGILLEARILASLNHPNIVKFLCCGHDHKFSRHFIAMQHMEAGLHYVIKKRAQSKNNPPFILLSAIDIMLQIACGTCYLHDNGIAHRDLKPSNVVVSQITTPHLQEYFQVKLVDFGLSKVNLKVSKSNTISYPRRGTTLYMPPEIFKSGKANWFKADAYSFGIMCSVILSGNEPFETTPRHKIYEVIKNGERPELPRDIPQDLVLLIKKCWNTNRHSRPRFVEICSRLAIIKHHLLKGESSSDKYKYNNVKLSNLYIQERIKKQSDARAFDYLQRNPRHNHSIGEDDISNFNEVTKATSVHHAQEQDKSNVLLNDAKVSPTQKQLQHLTLSNQPLNTKNVAKILQLQSVILPQQSPVMDVDTSALIQHPHLSRQPSRIDRNIITTIEQQQPLTPSREQQHRPRTPSRQSQKPRPLTPSREQQHQPRTPSRQSQKPRPLTPSREQQHRPRTPSRRSQKHRPLTPSREQQQPITPSRQSQELRPFTPSRQYGHLSRSESSYSRSLTPARQSSNVTFPKVCSIAIFWDIDNCPVPKEMNVENVASNIRIALRENLRLGVVNTYRAYDNFNHFPQTFREKCQGIGIDLIDVPNGKKNAVFKAIWVDMALFALDNPPPSTIFLITGDVGFSNALNKLSQRGYNVVIVIPKELGVISSLKSASSFVFDWSYLCHGKGLQLI